MARIPEEETAILGFLDKVARDPRYQRRVNMIGAGFFGSPGNTVLQSHLARQEEGVSIIEIWCDREDVLALQRRGYLDGIAPEERGMARIALTRQGRELIARGYDESPVVPAGDQNLNFHGPVGNVAASQYGSASISGSPTTIQVAETRALLDELRAAIVTADVPKDAKHDASLEVQAAKLELEKRNPNFGRIIDGIKQLPAGLNGVVAVTEAVKKLTDVMSGIFW